MNEARPCRCCCFQSDRSDAASATSAAAHGSDATLGAPLVGVGAAAPVVVGAPFAGGVVAAPFAGVVVGAPFAGGVVVGAPFAGVAVGLAPPSVHDWVSTLVETTHTLALMVDGPMHEPPQVSDAVQTDVANLATPLLSVEHDVSTDDVADELAQPMRPPTSFVSLRCALQSATVSYVRVRRYCPGNGIGLSEQKRRAKMSAKQVCTRPTRRRNDATTQRANEKLKTHYLTPTARASQQEPGYRNKYGSHTDELKRKPIGAHGPEHVESVAPHAYV